MSPITLAHQREAATLERLCLPAHPELQLLERDHPARDFGRDDGSVGAAPELVRVNLLNEDDDAGAIRLHRHTVGAEDLRDCTTFLVLDDCFDVLVKLRSRVRGRVELHVDDSRAVAIADMTLAWTLPYQ